MAWWKNRNNKLIIIALEPLSRQAGLVANHRGSSSTFGLDLSAWDVSRQRYEETEEGSNGLNEEATVVPTEQCCRVPRGGRR